MSWWLIFSTRKAGSCYYVAIDKWANQNYFTCFLWQSCPIACPLLCCICESFGILLFRQTTIFHLHLVLVIARRFHHLTPAMSMDWGKARLAKIGDEMMEYKTDHTTSSRENRGLKCVATQWRQEKHETTSIELFLREEMHLPLNCLRWYFFIIYERRNNSNAHKPYVLASMNLFDQVQFGWLVWLNVEWCRAKCSHTYMPKEMTLYNGFKWSQVW